MIKTRETLKWYLEQKINKSVIDSVEAHVHRIASHSTAHGPWLIIDRDIYRTLQRFENFSTDGPVWDYIHTSVRDNTLDAVYDVIYVSLYENVNNSIRDFMTDYEFN